MEVTEGRRKVIVAVDDTEVSSYAFTWGLLNLIRKDDHVVVLTAASYAAPDAPTTHLATGNAPEPGAPLVAAAEEALLGANLGASSGAKTLVNKYLQLLLQSEISCEGEVVRGNAARWIADEGERLHADVIIVGSGAPGLVKRTLLGSVSDYVLHNAPCTVAIVRQSEDALSVHDPLGSSKGPRKIVIAVDESDEAIHAFTWALKNFCRSDDKVIIYHVHHPITAPIFGVTAAPVIASDFAMEEVYAYGDTVVKDEVASLKESQKVVEKFMEYATQKSEVQCEGMVVTGETQAKVIEGLNALQADAVVVGTHDRGAVARTFLGSVSDTLAHNSPCPLIVVKAGKGESAVDGQTTTPHEHAS